MGEAGMEEALDSCEDRAGGNRTGDGMAYPLGAKPPEPIHWAVQS